MQKPQSQLEDINEKMRREVMKNLEPHGLRAVAELDDMSEGERTKWLFWNLHENLDAVRKMEPTLIGHVTATQLTVSDGQSVWEDRVCLEKRIELNCKWSLQLTYSVYQDEKSFEVGEGWVDLVVSDKPPSHPILSKNQKAYLDADNGLYPNQLFMYGWITEDAWKEIRPQVYNANPTCRTDIMLLDSFLYPVKPGFDFVTGPAGSIGISNFEFRIFSHPTERRLTRRGDLRQRT